MTSMVRAGPALATVTKQGLCREPLIIHLTLISTPTYWIFQTGMLQYINLKMSSII